MKTISPIATIYTDFPEKFGIPRQSGRVEELIATIVFESAFRNPDALRGITDFSHLWLLFDFSAVEQGEFHPTVRPPRLGGNAKVGVFASRSPFRPNGIGLSCVKLLRVEHTPNQGDVLVVAGADLLNGTPIYDIKPYLPYADSKPQAVGGYADGVADYRLDVQCAPELLAKIPPQKQQALLGCLADDPRPSYVEADDRVYGMKFSTFNIKFRVQSRTLIVLSVESISCK
jgi:tRNA-Thr(GGU) m(6)t(6)A37 methyltransferase TsaA